MVVHPRTIGMYACLSLCACVNENDREKECYADMNEGNDAKEKGRINVWHSVLFLRHCATH